MKCPQCESPSDVVDSRKLDPTIRRRRQCREGHRFTTEETLVVHEPRQKEIKTVVMVEPWAERIFLKLEEEK